jgi:GH24 family phage-related lysozyme (muramidase)
MNDIDQYVADLEAHEGLPADTHGAYPYLDSVGLVTFGIGCMVRNEAAFMTYPWVDFRGVPCEASYAWNHLMAEGQPHDPHPAAHYAPVTTTRLPVDYCRRLCRDRLHGEFLPAIRAAFRDAGAGEGRFEHMPPAAARVLVDCAWTTGAAGFAREWPHLIAACKAGDWDTAEEECSSNGMGALRKNWRQSLLRSLA